MHVRGADGEAKFCLYPSVHLSRSDGFDSRTLRELADVVEQNTAFIGFARKTPSFRGCRKRVVSRYHYPDWWPRHSCAL
ncbi:DUF4160 domain-containing protein, partial [Undibacterium sp. 5I2]